MVVADLEGTLSEKKSRAEIEDSLDVLCSTLSDPVHAQCEKMVAKYTEEIIDMILQEFTPKQMCAGLFFLLYFLRCFYYARRRAWAVRKQ